MKTLADESLNQINLVGKLLDATFATGTTKTGAPYERANATIRVTQTFGGREETSEIPLSMFATQYTKAGAINPAYQSIQALKGMHTAQMDGYDKADVVSFNGTTISENAYVSNSGMLIDGWQLRGSFVNVSKMSDVAAFKLDIFILGIKPEVDREGDTTGRLIVRGAMVQYGGRIDVIDFIVEEPSNVDYIERNWNEGDTVTIKGRIRVTSIEETSKSESSWGEDVPDTTTRYVRELIITKGDDQGKDEDFAYDPVEIKKGFNVRKAMHEQLLLDAKNKSQKSSAPAASSSSGAKSKYGWE